MNHQANHEIGLIGYRAGYRWSLRGLIRWAKSLSCNSRGGTRTHDPGIMSSRAPVAREALTRGHAAPRGNRTHRSATVWLPPRLPLFLLIGCQSSWTAPKGLTPLERTAVMDSAATDALGCGVAHDLQPVRTYASIRFWADPNTRFGGYASLAGAPDDASTRPDGNVVLRTELQANRRVIAHELLHSLFNLYGKHHAPVFAACGLYPL